MMRSKMLNRLHELARRGHGRPMIVLEQDHVEKTRAMVLATALSHGVLVEQPPTRDRLPRVQYPGSTAGNGLNILMRQRRDTAEMLDKVQRGSFRGQDPRHQAGNGCDAIAWLEQGSVLEMRYKFETGVDAG